MAFYSVVCLLVKPCNTVLHIFEADVGVHVSRSCWRGVAEFNTSIPARSKQLWLITKTSENKYLGRAKWVDPGFMLRGEYPEVSLVRLHVPGHNPGDFVPEVIATNSGFKVNSMILSAGRVN